MLHAESNRSTDLLLFLGTKRVWPAVAKRTPMALRLVKSLAPAAVGTTALAALALDASEAHAAGIRARTAAWDLARHGSVTFPPLEGTAATTDSKSRSAQRSAYHTEVRAHVERTWASIVPHCRFGHPSTYPDPLRMTWRERIMYGVTEPVTYSEDVQAHSGHLYRSTSAAGPQLTVAAFLDPRMRTFHYGRESHPFLRYQVSLRWYLLPWLGPPSNTIALHGSAQSWRLLTWPLKPDAEAEHRAFPARLGTPHIDGGGGGVYGGDGPLGPQGRDAEKRLLWHLAAQVVVLFACDNLSDVTAARGATATWPGSHLVVARVLRRIAEEPPCAGETPHLWPALQAGIAEWGRQRAAISTQPVLRAGWRTLNCGDLVHARCHALEPMPPTVQGEQGEPRIIQNAKTCCVGLETPLEEVEGGRCLKEARERMMDQFIAAVPHDAPARLCVSGTDVALGQLLGNSGTQSVGGVIATSHSSATNDVAAVATVEADARELYALVKRHLQLQSLQSP